MLLLHYFFSAIYVICEMILYKANWFIGSLDTWLKYLPSKVTFEYYTKKVKIMIL